MSWGPPQGPQGYPPQGYGQQQQQPQQYGYPQQQRPYAPPPKKGMGAGVIIAIVAGLFGVLVVVGGVVAYFVFRADDGSTSSSSSSSSVNADHSEVLKTKAEALLTAVKTGKSKEVEGPLLDLAVTPETAKAWFTATFEPKAADDLYGYWDRQVFPNIADMAGTFKKAIEYDRTEVRVTRFANKADVEACNTPFCNFRGDNLVKVFAAMKKPQPLYAVSLAKAGSKPGLDDEDVFYFAEVKGSFTYLGDMLML